MLSCDSGRDETIAAQAPSRWRHSGLGFNDCSPTDGRWTTATLLTLDTADHAGNLPQLKSSLSCSRIASQRAAIALGIRCKVETLTAAIPVSLSNASGSRFKSELEVSMKVDPDDLEPDDAMCSLQVACDKAKHCKQTVKIDIRHPGTNFPCLAGSGSTDDQNAMS